MVVVQVRTGIYCCPGCRVLNDSLHFNAISNDNRTSGYSQSIVTDYKKTRGPTEVVYAEHKSFFHWFLLQHQQ